MSQRLGMYKYTAPIKDNELRELKDKVTLETGHKYIGYW